MTAAHRSRRRVGAVALAVAVLGLSGCSGDSSADREAGAQAAAEEYVDAIANLDVEAADAMTDPEAFTSLLADEDLVDVREALPSAAWPITDAWVHVISPMDHGSPGVVEYVVGVTYTIDGLTGGDTITLRLDEDGDPGDVADWTVTDALTAEDRVHSSSSTRGVIGDAEFSIGSGGAPVWGYPAGYDVRSQEEPEVDPLRINLGVADAPPWDVSLPGLEVPER